MVAISEQEPATRKLNARASTKQSGEPVILSVIGLFPTTRQRGELVEILRSVSDLTRPAHGCRGCWIAEEDPMHNCLQYAELWDGEDSLHEHIRSELYLRLLSAMELSQKPPEIKFYYTGETKGFELIETLRNGGTVGI
jgi:quinol monooxygenase YgiN